MDLVKDPEVQLREVEVPAQRDKVSELFAPNEEDSGLGRRSLRGGMISLVARGLNGVIQIGSILVLARLLTPEDYGLIGMVSALTGFTSMLVSLGTPDAVTQRKTLTETDVSAVFWLSVSMGLGSALILTACGPLIAKFYGEPRLSLIVLVSALPFLLAALQSQHCALLRRAMRFRELGIVDVTANLASAAIAIGMAFYGLAYWALAARPVVYNALLVIGVWWRTRWFPSRPRNTETAREMVRFGINITGFTLSDFAGKSADRVAVGYRNGAAALGHYQNAQFVYDNAMDIMVNSLHPIAVASLSKLTSNTAEFRRLWGKALSTVVFYAMPAFGVLGVIGQDLVVVLLGPKWITAGALLSILAFRGIPHSAERTLGWLHVAAGRTDRWLRWGLLATAFHLVALLCGLPFGPQGVVVAYVACMFILFVPTLAYAGKPLGIGARDVLSVVWRPLVGSIAAAAFVLLLNQGDRISDSPIIRIAGCALIYMAVYIGMVVGALGMRSPLGVMFVLIKDMMPSSLARKYGIQRS